MYDLGVGRVNTITELFNNSIHFTSMRGQFFYSVDGSELSGKADKYPSLCQNLSNSISVRGDLFYVVDRRNDWFKFPNFKANHEKRVTLASPKSSCRGSSLASMCDLAIFMTGGID